MSDRIGVMYLGKMVEIGTGSELYSQPAHPVSYTHLDVYKRQS